MSDRTIITLTPDEDGVFVAEVPKWPGCLSQGDTPSEAARNILEAYEVYKESLIAHGELQAETANEVDEFLFCVWDA